MTNIVTRLAPSPTGKFMHLGNLRTLLFNYLWAKKMDGKFLVRLEDTDRDRYTPEFLTHFRETLDWLGIEPDFSFWNPDSNVGSFIQSERDYSDKVNFLLNRGLAYYAFDTQEELDELRKKGLKYDSTTRITMNNSLTNPSTDIMLQSGVPYVIRFKVEGGEDIHFKDQILGDITINSDQLDDKVLIKSNGIGSYHLCNVCDDHDMGVTHVLRGNEWVNSTPFHIILYRSFGWDVPQFCHLPLIMNPDGKGKLSKRTANKYGIPISAIGYYDDNGDYQKGWRELGYDPHSLLNALALIGWSPGNDIEIMTMDQMIDLFSLNGIGKSGARFDMDKAKWINSHHLKMMDVNELMKNCLFHDDRFDLSRMEKIVHLAAARSSFKHEMQSVVDIFFDVPQFDVSKVTDDFKKFASVVDFSGVDFEDVIAIKQYIYEVCEKLSLKMGKIMPVMRYVLVGGISGPDMVTTCHILGKEETLKRIKS